MMTVGFVGKFLTIFSAVAVSAIAGLRLSAAMIFPCLVYYLAMNRLFLQLFPYLVRVNADWIVSRKRLQVLVPVFTHILGQHYTLPVSTLILLHHIT